MTNHVKHAGVWKPDKPYVRHAGAWKEVQEAYARVGGVWRQTYSNIAGRWTYDDLDSTVEVLINGTIYPFTTLLMLPVPPNGTSFSFRVISNLSSNANYFRGDGLSPTRVDVAAVNSWSASMTVVNHDLNIIARFYDS